MGAADQGVNIALFGFDVQVDAIFGQRAFLHLTIGIGKGFTFVRGTRDRAAFAECRVFGDTVSNKVHGVIAGHVLFLQEIGRIAFAFGKNRNKHIGTGHFCPA